MGEHAILHEPPAGRRARAPGAGRGVATPGSPLAVAQRLLDASPSVAQLRVAEGRLSASPRVGQLSQLQTGVVQCGGKGKGQYGGKHALRSNKNQRRFEQSRRKHEGRRATRKSKPKRGRARRREAERREVRREREEARTTGGGRGGSSSWLPTLLLLLVLGGMMLPGASAQELQPGRNQTGPLRLGNGTDFTDFTDFGGLSLGSTNTTGVDLMQDFQMPLFDIGNQQSGLNLTEVPFYMPRWPGVVVNRGPNLDFIPNLDGLGRSEQDTGGDGFVSDFLTDPDFDESFVGSTWNQLTALENFGEGSWVNSLVGDTPHKILKNFSRQELAAIAKHYPKSWLFQAPRAMWSIYRPVERAVGANWDGQQKGNAIRHVNWIVNADRFSSGNEDFVLDLAKAHEVGRQGSMFDEVADLINNQIALRESKRSSGDSAETIGERLWSEGRLAKNANFVVGAPSKEELGEIAESWKLALEYLEQIEGGTPDFNEENLEFLKWAREQSE